MDDLPEREEHGNQAEGGQNYPVEAVGEALGALTARIEPPSGLPGSGPRLGGGSRSRHERSQSASRLGQRGEPIPVATRFNVYPHRNIKRHGLNHGFANQRGGGVYLSHRHAEQEFVM